MDFHSQWILTTRIYFSSLKGYIILHHHCFSYHLEIRFLLLSLFYPWVLPFCPPSCSSGIWRSWLHFPFYPFELWSPVQPICLETVSFFWFWDSISSSLNLFFFFGHPSKTSSDPLGMPVVGQMQMMSEALIW